MTRSNVYLLTKSLKRSQLKSQGESTHTKSSQTAAAVVGAFGYTIEVCDILINLGCDLSFLMVQSLFSPLFARSGLFTLLETETTSTYQHFSPLFKKAMTRKFVLIMAVRDIRPTTTAPYTMIPTNVFLTSPYISANRHNTFKNISCDKLHCLMRCVSTTQF